MFVRVFVVSIRKEEDIEKLRATAEKAINVSSAAFDITKDAVNQQKNIRYARAFVSVA